MKPRIKTMGCLPANPCPSNLTSSTCGGTNCAQGAHQPAIRQRGEKASDQSPSLPNKKKGEEITPRVITCDACAVLTHSNRREKWRGKR